MIVPIYNLGHTAFFDAPRPGVSFTFFRNALMMLTGLGWETICADQESTQVLTATTNLLHQTIC